MNKFRLHKDCKISDLIRYGFKKDGTGYKMSVPLYTYRNRPVIIAIFEIESLDDFVRFEIKSNSDSLYSAFYDREFSNSKNNIVLIHSLNKLQNKINQMYKEKIISEVKDVCSV